MTQAGRHKDDEGKWLSQNVLRCRRCGRNFKSDKAADKHYDRTLPHGHRCKEPEVVGLVSYQNTYGATIWKEKRRVKGPDW
jgi:uncharacterized C2H2 Zn-finger protein